MTCERPALRRWLSTCLLGLAVLWQLPACSGGGGSGGGTPAAPTTISSQPASASVVAGAAVTFSVTAAGDQLAYQWQRSTDGGASWAAIGGAVAASHVIAAADLSQNGHLFRVVVSGAGGSVTSAAATLTVSAAPVAPVITSSPADLTVMAGTDARFTVTATGTTPAYRWQSSPDGTSWTDVAGATGATLTRTAVPATDDGLRWRAVVSNGAGTVTSNPALLTVRVQPSTFTALTSRLTGARGAHEATLLADGTVLLTGGFNVATLPAPSLDTAELYDPATNGFTVLANRMVSPRTSHTATLLLDGQVLLTGGQVVNNDGDGSDTAELYDPVAKRFTAIAARMSSPRGGHVAALLPGGKVLVTGGFNNSATALSSAELYDPATKTFTPLAATMTSRRADLAGAAVGGTVLLVGGANLHVNTDSAELYDPVTQGFTALTSKLSAPRVGHGVTLLSSGVVLVSGGGTLVTPVTSSTVLDTIEIWDPATQGFTAGVASLPARRFFHAQTLLQDGSVLVTGGGNVDGGTLNLFDDAWRSSP